MNSANIKIILKLLQFCGALSLFVLIIGFAAAAKAQNGALENNSRAPQDQPLRRQNLLQSLDLTPDQVRRIRALNQSKREATRTAVQNQRAARTAMDEAIYADVPVDYDIEQRTKEFLAAQAKVVRLRAALELQIRRILTPDQLIRFRELRSNAEPNQRPARPVLPLRRRFPANRPQP